jgi:RND family efflux transporter MFP subunit
MRSLRAAFVALALAAASSAPAAPASAGLATLRLEPAATTAERMLDGTVEAVNQATLAAQTAGRVSALEYDVDQQVAAGAVLVRIRSTEQVSGLAQAEAALREAQAREVEAEGQYRRIADMYQRKVVAKATYDDAVASRASAAARLEAARAGVQSAREGVDYTIVRAPYAGVVTARHVQLGESVAPGMPLVTVAGFGTLRVVADVPQSLMSQARTARRAIVYAGDRRIDSAALTFFPAAQAGGTFRVRVELPAGIDGLAPGMYVRVGLATGEATSLEVPATAVVERSELRAVYVVAPDGGVRLRQVRLGRERDGRYEVLAGLVAGDVIALDPSAAATALHRQAARDE